MKELIIVVNYRFLRTQRRYLFAFLSRCEARLYQVLFSASAEPGAPRSQDVKEEVLHSGVFRTGRQARRIFCYVAGDRNMRESALAVLLAWILAAQQGLCGKLEKIAQQPSNVLEDYYAYRHISIIHFNVPERSVAIVFKYVSNPYDLNAIYSCIQACLIFKVTLNPDL